MAKVRKVTVPGIAKLPAFCHATVVGDQVFVSGAIGARAGSMDLVDGGIGPQTAQVLANIEAILRACGCTFDDVAKVNVFLIDMADFAAMNEVYLGVFGDDPPARITTGCTGLALGALVEIDCIAFTP